MNPIRLYIDYDHRLYIEGLSSLLAEVKGLTLAGYATRADLFLDELPGINADVFIMDINMPVMSGISLCRLALEKKPELRILALTMYSDLNHIEKMLQSGATGYSLKSDNINELVRGIRSVASGRRYISPGIQETVVRKLSTRHQITESRSLENSQLTRRETEIVMLIIKEYSNTMIASELFISERTVETHRKNIFSKTNTSSALGLLRYALKEGLVSS